MTKRPFLLLVLTGILLCLFPVPASAREKLSQQDLEFVEKKWPEAKRSITGLRYIILQEGTGLPPKPGSIVSTTYSGTLLDGKVFDQSLDPAKPFKFRIGRTTMIEGFEEAVSHMKKGEKRLVIIPYELGYGTLGKLPTIPREATIVFEITLLDFEGPDSAAAKK